MSERGNRLDSLIKKPRRKDWRGKRAFDLIVTGITCDRQKHKNRNDVSFDDWVKTDLNCIENRGAWGDLKIVFRTPIAMPEGTGR